MDAIIPNNAFSQSTSDGKFITLWTGDDSLAVGDYVTHGNFVTTKKVGNFSVDQWCGMCYLADHTALTLHINNNDIFVACIFTWTDDTSANASLKTQKQITLPSGTRYASILATNILKMNDDTIIALVNLNDGDYLLFITYNGTSIPQTNFVKLSTDSNTAYDTAILRRCDDTHFVAIHEEGHIDLYTLGTNSVVSVKSVTVFFWS